MDIFANLKWQTKNMDLKKHTSISALFLGVLQCSLTVDGPPNTCGLYGVLETSISLLLFLSHKHGHKTDQMRQSKKQHTEAIVLHVCLYTEDTSLQQQHCVLDNNALLGQVVVALVLQRKGCVPECNASTVIKMSISFPLCRFIPRRLFDSHSTPYFFLGKEAQQD